MVSHAHEVTLAAFCAMAPFIPAFAGEELGPWTEPTVTSVSAGTVVCAEETTAGDAITIEAGEEGVLEKTGKGALYLASIPEGVGKVNVREGSLVLSVPASERVEWKIPGGDFEGAREPDGTFSPANIPAVWTADQGSWGGVPYKSVGVAFSGAKVWQGPMYTEGETPSGKAALVIFSTGSSLTTSFTPPAGTYKLKCRFKMWKGVWIGDPYMNMTDAYGTPALRAEISVNGGETITNYFWATSTSFVQRSGDNAFTVEAGDRVTLKLSQYAYYGAVVADDLVLESQDPEIIRNGGFETTSGSQDWQGFFEQAEAWTIGKASGRRTSVLDITKEGNDMLVPPAYPWAKVAQKYFIPNVKSGKKALLVQGLGMAEQQISFLNPGVYQLSCSLHSYRPQAGDDDGSKGGRNPLRFSLTREGKSQVIAEAGVMGTVWLDKSWLFRVAEAGTYTFTIAGLDGESNRKSFVDDVKIVPVEFDAATSVELPAKLSVRVSPGAKLRLDYPGTCEINRLKVASGSVAGVVDATHESGSVEGIGSLKVDGIDGFILQVR